jgi:two-component system cell cycle response regulator DivK
VVNLSKRVLVVEDNELNLKLFCDLLRAHDYATEPVRDGREAVERARAFSPDLIVMDIQLPHVSGLELIETCKADAELNAIPIMAVTAYAGKEDEERVRAAGAEAYVSKPISLMRFIGEVVALTPEEAEAAEEAAAEDSLPEETPVEAAAPKPAFPEDLFPEDSPQGLAEAVTSEDPLPEEEPQAPAVDVAKAEDPLPEDLPDSPVPDDTSSVTPAHEPGSRYSSTAGNPAEGAGRQLDPGSEAGVTKEEGSDAASEEKQANIEPPAGEADDETPI